jgi:hypothetical protein
VGRKSQRPGDGRSASRCLGPFAAGIGAELNAAVEGGLRIIDWQSNKDLSRARPDRRNAGCELWRALQQTPPNGCRPCACQANVEMLGACATRVPDDTEANARRTRAVANPFEPGRIYDRNGRVADEFRSPGFEQK